MVFLIRFTGFLKETGSVYRWKKRITVSRRIVPPIWKTHVFYVPACAEKEYLKAIKLRKKWAVPYFNLGNLYYKIRDTKQSEKFYRKALSIDAENPDVLNNLAWLLYELKRPEEAKVFIEKALEISRRQEYLDTYNKIIELE